MAVKKSQLYRTLWESANKLRGGMDASQYKDYVLTLLFVKYVSDKYKNDPFGTLRVPDGFSFDAILAARGTKEIGDTINKVVGEIARENRLSDVGTMADFNDEGKFGKGREGVERLTDLVNLFTKPELDFGKNRAGGDDLLGDAYEFLMRHFATESGKAKGQFYTPAEVSRVMARVIGIRNAPTDDVTIYDPTCGSGSLLIKAADEGPRRVTVYGQEKDVSTTALARMNMILHGHDTAEIAPGGSSTLSAPAFAEHGKLRRFDYVVANPPFSYKDWTQGLSGADPYERWGTSDDGAKAPRGVDLFSTAPARTYERPPDKNGDYAFLLHIVASLKATGTGAVILPHGVLFRGGKEGTIREQLLRRGLLKAVIGLPANLFYGTGIPACILVLDKSGAAPERPVFLIDASRGFVKEGPKNRLRERDLHRIVDVYERGEDVPRYARLVPFAEIERNGYNLNLPRYVDASEPEDLHDLEAHLRGGIPVRDLDALGGFWDEMPGLRDALVQPDRPGYARLRVPASDLRKTVLAHPDHAAFSARVRERYARWEAFVRPTLDAFGQDGDPKALVHTLGEALLDAFDGLPLLDRYGVYQHLRTRWAEEGMQDDAYLVAYGGWQPLDEHKQPNMDLLPGHLVAEAYFPKELKEQGDLAAKVDEAQADLDALLEEHDGDEGLLNDAKTDKGKITAASVNARLKLLPQDADSKPERDVLTTVRAAMTRLKTAKDALDDFRDVLNAKVNLHYRKLTPADVQRLVVEGKWLAPLRSDLEADEARAFAALVARLTELARRYDTPLPTLAEQAHAARARVSAHLEALGLTWN